MGDVLRSKTRGAQVGRPLVAQLRRILYRAAATKPRFARLIELAGKELTEAAARAHGSLADRDAFYGARYFGEGRDPSGDRQGKSGYATYDRVSSNADIAGYVLWRHFAGAQKVLDVGCATGFLVEVLRELGLDATGCDVSRYAVDHAAPGARGHIRVADPVRGLPYASGEMDLVCALETLEHLRPDEVPRALRELRRVCGGWCYATIPSFGPNGGGGPDGYLEGKVRPERKDHYDALGPGFDGPLPYEDLARDEAGEPIEGHLTIASFRWWTLRFEEAGFVRHPEIEQLIYSDLVPELANAWDVYVLEVPEARPGIAQFREPGRSLRDLGLRHPLYEHSSGGGDISPGS